MNDKWIDALEIGPECNERFIECNKVPEFDELKVNVAGTSQLTGRYLVARSDPNFHAVLYSVDGSITLHTLDGVETVGRYQLITVPAHKPYIMELEAPYWNMVWFQLASGEKWDKYCNNRPTVEYCDSGHQIYHLLSLVFYERDPSLRRPSVRQIETYLEQTLSNTTIRNTESQRLDLLISELEQKLHYAWSVDEMAKLAQYSASHLHRLFIKHYQLSPVQLLIKLRMDRAKYLLSFTGWSIEQISEQVGYSDVFNFSKRFKKSVGLAPGQHRTKAFKR